jgi:hypothetical protein
MGWWDDPGPRCNRCWEFTAGCPECKGVGSVDEIFSRMTCSECDGSGFLCVTNDHGKLWQ